jgi:hypothetical protein
VVRERELLAGGLVQIGGEALGEAAAVDEDHRRAVRAHELDEARMDARPDRPRDARGLGALRSRAELAHVVDRHLHHELDRLGCTRVEHRHGARHEATFAVDRPAAEEARDLLERALRRREAHALEGRRIGPALATQGLEPLEREEEVRAALARQDGVDLVDDHGVHVDERLARVGREDEEERLGRRDEDVGRVLGLPHALLGLRVTRADRDVERARRDAEASRAALDAGERGAEVALHVHREGLERREVEDLAPSRVFTRALGEERTIDRGEEGRERLARSRRREQQRALAEENGRPRAGLRLRGRLEGLGEPRARRFVERRPFAPPGRDRLRALVRRPRCSERVAPATLLAARSLRHGTTLSQLGSSVANAVTQLRTASGAERRRCTCCEPFTTYARWWVVVAMSSAIASTSIAIVSGE